MDNQVLVAYATKCGSTAEIAERIGQVLQQAELSAEVRNVKKVDDLTPYSAVVLGSAVYMFKWRKEAAKFLQKNEQALAQRPVWLFSSGPTEEGDVVALMKGWTFPEKLIPVANRIKPRDITIFHGVLDLQKLDILTSWMLKTSKVPVGDFRDWDAIDAWAAGIGADLKVKA